ncbi:MAG: glycoside hydrolase, partial [Actinomycetota bacterium]|nr:glycoside hydrolase [Actinomycetota bacterium]
MAAPVAHANVDPLVRVSGQSPFGPSCNGAVQPPTSVEYRGTEVEPWIDANPTNGDNLVAMWQQDRYSDGGANGLGVGVSRSGGASWTQVPPEDLPKFTRCQGASTGSDGDYERASDPWVSFGPDGHGYAVSLSFNESRNLANAILVSESHDGGATWGPISVIRRDTSPDVFNDKEAITADQTDARYVYVVWDRLEDLPNNGFKGPTWFARSADGGASWEAAREIFDPGVNDQTIGNQIVVMPDGDLVNGYSLFKDATQSVAVMRSSDKGASWAPQVVVSSHDSVGVFDPRDRRPVRTGDILPELASDERPGTDTVYMVWQDARFSGSQRRDQIVLSRSGDGGNSWSAPKRISTVPGTQAFTPAIRVDAAGNLGVTYYDFRNDTVASPTLDTDAWFLRSTDGGQTFTEERLTPSSFDMRAAPVARGFFVGDYAGLATVGETFKPLFSQTGAAGTDVFATTVRAPFPSGPTPPPVPPTPVTPTRPSVPTTPVRRPPASLLVARRGRLGRRFASFRVRCLKPRCTARMRLSAVLR